MVKAIVGACWGDEGKGKITDILAEDSDKMCIRDSHHTAGDVAECKHLPGAQPHRGALHAYHFRRDRHGITPMLTFKCQHRRHDFRRARNGQYLAAVLFK